MAIHLLFIENIFHYQLQDIISSPVMELDKARSV